MSILAVLKPVDQSAAAKIKLLVSSSYQIIMIHNMLVHLFLILFRLTVGRTPTAASSLSHVPSVTFLMENT
jgi:hypothetical protein